MIIDKISQKGYQVIGKERNFKISNGSFKKGDFATQNISEVFSQSFPMWDYISQSGIPFQWLYPVPYKENLFFLGNVLYKYNESAKKLDTIKTYNMSYKFFVTEIQGKIVMIDFSNSTINLCTIDPITYEYQIISSARYPYSKSQQDVFLKGILDDKLIIIEKQESSINWDYYLVENNQIKKENFSGIKADRYGLNGFGGLDNNYCILTSIMSASQAWLKYYKINYATKTFELINNINLPTIKQSWQHIKKIGNGKAILVSTQFNNSSSFISYLEYNEKELKLIKTNNFSNNYVMNGDIISSGWYAKNANIFDVQNGNFIVYEYRPSQRNSGIALETLLESSMSSNNFIIPSNATSGQRRLATELEDKTILFLIVDPSLKRFEIYFFKTNEIIPYNNYYGKPILVQSDGTKGQEVKCIEP